VAARSDQGGNHTEKTHREGHDGPASDLENQPLETVELGVDLDIHVAAELENVVVNPVEASSMRRPISAALPLRSSSRSSVRLSLIGGMMRR
jgi:hypothetical protein